MFRVKEFNYVIFDEAHMLKNMNTQRYEALIQFNVRLQRFPVLIYHRDVLMLIFFFFS